MPRYIHLGTIERSYAPTGIEIDALVAHQEREYIRTVKTAKDTPESLELKLRNYRAEHFGVIADSDNCGMREYEDNMISKTRKEIKTEARTRARQQGFQTFKVTEFNLDLSGRSLSRCLPEYLNLYGITEELEEN